jgi:DNA mismatch repair protein MSH6
VLFLPEAFHVVIPEETGSDACSYFCLNSGIPASVLQRANEKSIDFEANYGKRRCATKDKMVCAQKVDSFATIRDLFHVVKEGNHQGDQAARLSMICQVQTRARAQATEG